MSEKTSELIRRAETDGPYIAVRVETTGLNSVSDRIVEIGLRIYMPNSYGVYYEYDFRKWYIRPDVEEIPESVYSLLGLEKGFFDDKPDEETVIKEVAEYLSTFPVCGYYNHKFDDIFLTEAFARHGLVYAPESSLDLYEYVKELISPELVENYKLKTIMKHYRVPSASLETGDAEYDTEWVGKLLNTLIRLAVKAARAET